MKLDIKFGDAQRSFEIVSFDGPKLHCLIDGRAVLADVIGISSGTYSILINNSVIETRVEETPAGLRVIAGHAEFLATVRDPRKWGRGGAAGLAREGREQISAPMPGKVVRILFGAGDKVEAGQGILVVEAMKMQNEVRAAKSGVIERVLVKEGQTVAAGEALAIVS